MYMSVRSAKASGLSVSNQFLGQFIVSGILNVFLLIAFRVNMLIPLWQIGLIVINTIVITYLSNIYSLKAIEAAPNPGLSLVIQKSYVVFTAIFSAIFLMKELTLLKAVAIGFIVLFGFLIVKDDKKKDEVKSDRKWVLFSFITFFGFGILSLVESYFVKELGINTLVMIMYARLVLIPIEFIKKRKEIMKTDYRKLLNMKNTLILVSIGLGQFVFNYFMKEGYKTAPNPGYVSAVNTASIAVITLLSFILFKDKLSKTKFLGIVGILASLVVLYI
jgi:drug/metabolite transporter (DMT)-like permease